MAAYNGSDWIEEQIRSILDQQDVSVSLVVSIDPSEDITAELVNSRFASNPQVQILQSQQRSGSAARNFFYLLTSCDFSNVDFVALADQDDIWLPDKLKRSAEQITKNNVEFYSSNVIAFWENGKRKTVKKKFKIPTWNHLFESAGPGCTYVMKSQRAIELGDFLREKNHLLAKIELHDWLIFSWARTNGYEWYIDEYSGVLYRQHSNNAFGVNSGWKAMKSRWDMLTKGWYRNQVLLISGLFGDLELSRKLVNLSVFDRIYLAANTKKMRRYWFDHIILALAFLFMKKDE